MADSVGKWKEGSAYGPVLSQTDLYLLKTELHINPVLQQGGFFFNLSTGQAGKFTPNSDDTPFDNKEEPVTLPRVEQLILITEHSPWCTIVENRRGVTLGDVTDKVWRDYSEPVTDAELTALPARVQDHIRRTASHNQQPAAPGGGWNMYYTGTPATNGANVRPRRCDWLRERIYFESLTKKDQYATNRLGFTAPNVFVLTLST